MRWKTRCALILFGCLLLAGGPVPPCGAEDFVAKQGISLYRTELQNLAQQTLKLDPSEKEQREFLDRLFQMKFSEAERMFQICSDTMEVKRVVAELHLLKAILAESMGNWIQSYFCLQDAAKWSRQPLTQSLQIGEKTYNMAKFSHEVESKARQWGNPVRFVIKPFEPDKMFRPNKVVLARSEEEENVQPKNTGNLTRTHARQDRSSPGGRWDTNIEPVGAFELSEKDEAYLLERFNKALYAYYYDPTEKNAQFEIYLPHGEYYVYEKDFTIHPVDFVVTEQNTQVILQPARWFRLTVTDEVHPSDVHLSFHGVEWKDFEHVPFGSYRIRVKNDQFTAPAVRMTFVPVADDGSEEDNVAGKGEIVVVPDRGEYRLSLRARTGNEKLRYSLLGF